MILHWPQITMLVLMAMSLGMSLVNDGKRRLQDSFLRTLIGNVITIFLLYKGGFFR